MLLLLQPRRIDAPECRELDDILLTWQRMAAALANTRAGILAGKARRNESILLVVARLCELENAVGGSGRREAAQAGESERCLLGRLLTGIHQHVVHESKGARRVTLACARPGDVADHAIAAEELNLGEAGRQTGEMALELASKPGDDRVVGAFVDLRRQVDERCDGEDPITDGRRDEDPLRGIATTFVDRGEARCPVRWCRPFELERVDDRLRIGRPDGKPVDLVAKRLRLVRRLIERHQWSSCGSSAMASSMSLRLRSASSVSAKMRRTAAIATSTAAFRTSAVARLSARAIFSMARRWRRSS